MNEWTHEMAQKNIQAAGKFFLYLVEHPEEVDKVPDNAIVIGLPHDDPTLLEVNLRLASDIARNSAWGKDVRHPIVLWPE